MLWMIGAALAATPEPVTVDVAIATWNQRAPRLAKRACKGEPVACRATVEAQIRDVLRTPDEEETLMALEGRPALEPLVAFARLPEVAEYLYNQVDACLEKAAVSTVELAPVYARTLCKGRQESCIATEAAFIHDLVWNGVRDPDPFHNELDARQDFADAEQRAIIERLRALVEQRCP